MGAVRRPIPDAMLCSCGSRKVIRGRKSRCEDCDTVEAAIAAAAELRIDEERAKVVRARAAMRMDRRELLHLARLSTRARELLDGGALSGGRIRRLALVGSAGDQLRVFVAQVEEAGKHAAELADLTAGEIAADPELRAFARRVLRRGR